MAKTENRAELKGMSLIGYNNKRPKVLINWQAPKYQLE